MREESTAARGVLALSIAGILSKVISLLYTPFLVAILGDDGYGIYGKVTEVFLFVYAITSVGTQPAVAKVVSELSAKGKLNGAVRALKVSRRFYFWFGLVSCLLMMVLAFPYARLIGAESIAYGIIALAPCVLITALLSVYRGFMQGKNNMTAIAVSQVLEQFVNVSISLLFAFLLSSISIPMGVAGAQIGTSVAALFACFYIIYCFFKRGYIIEADSDIENKVNDSKILSRVIMYSIPIVLSAGLQNLGGLVDMGNVTLRLQSAGFGIDAANTLYGYYSLYKTLYGVPLVMITAIGTTVLPAISRARVLHDNKEIRKNIRYAFRVALIIAIPAAVGLSLVSEPLYISLFGKKDAAYMMEIGAFILILMTITQIQNVILQGINKFYYILFSFLIGIIFKIIINYIFVGIHSINIYGVLIGNCFWNLIPAVMNHRKICSTMKMKMPILRIITKPLIGAIAMGVVILLLQMPVHFIYKFIEPSRLTSIPVTILLVGAGGFTYAYIMVLIGGIKLVDLERISPRIARMMPRFIRKRLK